jgi:integrase
MAVYKQKKSNKWWYKFTWNGEPIRESTKQTNKRVAEQMEAAHKTALAKGEVGIRERKPIPTLKDFAGQDFLPYVRSTFAAKVKTKEYYEYGVKSLLRDAKLAGERLDAITSEKVAGYVAKRQDAGLQVASINRELQVLRRMFHLAQEWGKVEKVLPRVRMLSGERHRERVLTADEEKRYLEEAQPLLRDVATILLDCGLRPEECFRLKWENVRDGSIEIQFGKTDNARRRIPVTQRVAAVLEMRKTDSASEWVFPAGTKSGHIEPASLKRQHLNACEGRANKAENAKRKDGEPKTWNVEPFPLYTLRHTCLTGWAPHMDPWALAYVAGHRDMSITKRYIHPQQGTLRDAMERARTAQGGHTSGHTGQMSANGPGASTAAIQ